MWKENSKRMIKNIQKNTIDPLINSIDRASVVHKITSELPYKSFQLSVKDKEAIKALFDVDYLRDYLESKLSKQIVEELKQKNYIWLLLSELVVKLDRNKIILISFKLDDGCLIKESITLDENKRILIKSKISHNLTNLALSKTWFGDTIESMFQARSGYALKISEKNPNLKIKITLIGD